MSRRCRVKSHLTLTFMTLSYWARSVVSMLPMAKIPALLIRTSSRPKWATVCSTVLFTVSSSVRSPGTSKGCTYSMSHDRLDKLKSPPKWNFSLSTHPHADGKSGGVSSPTKLLWSFIAKQYCSIRLTNWSRWDSGSKTQELKKNTTRKKRDNIKWQHTARITQPKSGNPQTKLIWKSNLNPF